MRALARLKAHNLQQQASASLMDRLEAKFAVPDRLINDFITNMQSNYSVLEIDSKRQFGYESLYFDTSQLAFYMNHHNGKLNRHKIRARRYHEANIAFLEVKCKTNKGRVFKQRIELDTQKNEAERVNLLIKSMTGSSMDCLTPVINIEYERLTLMSLNGNERVTIDSQIQFYSIVEKKLVNLNGLSIIEIKVPKKITGSQAYRELIRLGQKQQKFSKYCIAIGLTDQTGLKTNNFKPTLSRIKHLVTTGMSHKNFFFDRCESSVNTKIPKSLLFNHLRESVA